MPDKTVDETTHEANGSIPPIVSLLADNLRLNPTLAAILAGVMAIASAGAVIAAVAKVDLTTALIGGAYIVAFGLVVFVLTRALDDKVLKALVSWVVTLVFLAWLVGIPVSIVAQGRWGVPPTACFFRPWDCESVIDGKASAEATAQNVKKVEASAVQADATGYASLAVRPRTVWLHYAGAIRTEDMVNLRDGLREAGWPVDAPKGGTRLDAALGYYEVRFSTPGLSDAAKALAKIINGTDLANQPVLPLQQPDIDPDTLEVWISR